jgi:hypothetical protein
MDSSSMPQDYVKHVSAPQAEVRKAERKPDGIPKIDVKNPVFVLTKRVSSDVGGIIHVAEKGIVTKRTGERTAELKVERERKTDGKETKDQIFERKYRELHATIDKEATFNNIDHILKTPRRMFLEADIYGLYKWKFDKDGNIVIGGTKIIQKWSPEYKKMIEAWLAELRMIMHALISDAEQDWVDPDSLK